MLVLFDLGAVELLGRVSMEDREVVKVVNLRLRKLVLRVEVHDHSDHVLSVRHEV